MTLTQLLSKHYFRPTQSVPDWMLGCFRRRSISFASGESDQTTIVYWFQSRNFTLDLRLPLNCDQPQARPWADYSAAELQKLANYEGWQAECEWNGDTLRWHDGCSRQINNRWPEPARLYRIGNCMIEFAPSGAYVEDWRVQASIGNALIGLRLLEERNPQTGEVLHRGGGLIICGDNAALVLGRPEPLTSNANNLPEHVSACRTSNAIAQALDFETSVARGSMDNGYTVIHSTHAQRLGQPLLATEGFEWQADGQHICHRFTEKGEPRERWYQIDTLEPSVNLGLATTTTAEAAEWFERETKTLTRYAEVFG